MKFFIILLLISTCLSAQEVPRPDTLHHQDVALFKTFHSGDASGFSGLSVKYTLNFFDSPSFEPRLGSIVPRFGIGLGVFGDDKYPSGIWVFDFDLSAKIYFSSMFYAALGFLWEPRLSGSELRLYEYTYDRTMWRQDQFLQCVYPYVGVGMNIRHFLVEADIGKEITPSIIQERSTDYVNYSVVSRLRHTITTLTLGYSW